MWIAVGFGNGIAAGDFIAVLGGTAIFTGCVFRFSSAFYSVSLLAPFPAQPCPVMSTDRRVEGSY
jgi:hypothetical protein